MVELDRVKMNQNPSRIINCSDGAIYDNERLDVRKNVFNVTDEKSKPMQIRRNSSELNFSLPEDPLKDVIKFTGSNPEQQQKTALNVSNSAPKVPIARTSLKFNALEILASLASCQTASLQVKVADKTKTTNLPSKQKQHLNYTVVPSVVPVVPKNTKVNGD